MDPLLIAFILGVVEAAAEFLPISSTGHLIIVADWLDFHGEAARSFEIFIQFGAVLAVCWMYRQRLYALGCGAFGYSPHVRCRGATRHGDLTASVASARRTLAHLAIAFLPAAVVGLLLGKFIKQHLFNPPSVALALIVGGVVILLVERRPQAQIRVEQMQEMSWREALVVGCAQVLALIPGVSRSGSTIIGGMLGGMSRVAATEFSFFLAIPTMAAASIYSLYRARDALSIDHAPMFAVGFITSFVVARLIVGWLIAFVARHSFAVFGWYRIVLGLAVLAYFHDKAWINP